MKLSERAWQAWPVLALAAGNRQIITYEILAKLTGMHAAGLGSVLEQIQSYCLLNDLPPLTALVVNKGTGLPSEGFVATKNVPRAFADVFEHDWLSTPCPSPDDLAEATRIHPSNGIVPIAPFDPDVAQHE
ncbi:MAG: hypothetical protein H0W30_04520 [Gemmatimonadaceae bacterium]|nr:hypothetical protein [Gemmatimonadaceae bacterium]MBA3557846.1 hypothetical protein [Gemmatimonadaceae bacterium]